MKRSMQMEERYINPHIDFGFKRLFGSDKDLKAYEESISEDIEKLK